MQVIVQGLSLLGAILILGAFVALQMGRWTTVQPVYLWWNLIGAILLLGVAVIDRRIGFILIEVVWAVVSLHSIARPRQTRAENP